MGYIGQRAKGSRNTYIKTTSLTFYCGLDPYSERGFNFSLIFLNFACG